MPSPKGPPLDRVATVRRWLGLSQRQLGQLLGVSGQMVAQIERGTNKPSTRIKARLVALVAARLATVLFEPEPDPRKEG